MEAFAGLAVLSGLWLPAALLFCGLAASEAAQSKNRSGVAWFLSGLVFGPLGLLGIAACDKYVRKQVVFPGRLPEREKVLTHKDIAGEYADPVANPRLPR